MGLERIPEPPQTPGELTVADLKRYWLQRRAELNVRSVHHELWAVRNLLAQMPSGSIADDALAWIYRRFTIGSVPPLPGYSDREFMAIMSAARSEVAAIRARLKHGHALLARYAHEPESLSSEERQLGAVLTDIATTGVVPAMGHLQEAWDTHPMMELARHLFVTDFDLGPLVTLAVGISGRNCETIKDLTVEHEVLEDKAVRVEVVKRRRGPSRMFETVHWEIGTPNQQLQRPGGYYLLLEQMMQLGRSFSGTTSLWSVWNPRQGHYGAFDDGLHVKTWHMSRWKQRHELLDDNGQPLQISLPRLKKTVDVRNTRAAGGHLPSSIRSNTMPVLFANYLRGDPSVQDWAGQVITAALSDAETEAYVCQARVLAGPVTPHRATAELELTHSAASDLLAGRLDTAFAACADIERSPLNDHRRCTASFLMCFGCANALVTHDHIPRLKALLDWLIDQRSKTDLDLWWHQYGPTWSAITEHIRPKFTPAEWDQAQPADGITELLALLDGPREPR